MTLSSVPDLQLRFRRYECKYLLTEAQAHRVQRFIAPYVELDPFARRRSEGRYGISSLYLDSAGGRLYRETRDGIRDRFKLRIRAYSDHAGDPVFFEVKKRRDRVIMKERARVRRSDMLVLAAGGNVDTAYMPPEERESFESFVYRMRAIQAQPIVLIRYVREALQGLFDPTCRVTFDRLLHSSRRSRPGPFYGGSDWDVVEGSKVILELKFNGQCPSWMAAVIRHAGLHRISYSKYTHAVDASARAWAMPA